MVDGRLSIAFVEDVLIRSFVAGVPDSVDANNKAVVNIVSVAESAVDIIDSVSKAASVPCVDISDDGNSVCVTVVNAETFGYTTGVTVVVDSRSVDECDGFAKDFCPCDKNDDADSSVVDISVSIVENVWPLMFSVSAINL